MKIIGGSNDSFFKENPVLTALLISKIESKKDYDAENVLMIPGSWAAIGSAIAKWGDEAVNAIKNIDIFKDPNSNGGVDAEADIDIDKLDAWLSDLSVKIKNSLGDLKGMMPDEEGRKQMLKDLEAEVKAIDENKNLESILTAEQYTELIVDLGRRIGNAKEDGTVTTEEFENIIIDFAVDFAFIKATDSQGNIGDITLEQIYNMPVEDLGGMTISEYIKEGIDAILDDMQAGGSGEIEEEHQPPSKPSSPPSTDGDCHTDPVEPYNAS